MRGPQMTIGSIASRSATPSGSAAEAGDLTSWLVRVDMQTGHFFWECQARSEADAQRQGREVAARLGLTTT